jgi:hypothetical protein
MKRKMSQPDEIPNITKFFAEFGLYSLKKFKENTKYITEIKNLFNNKNNPTTDLIYKRLDLDKKDSDTSPKTLVDCNFLNSNQILDEVNKTITEVLKTNETNYVPKNRDEVYDQIIRKVNEIKIKEFINNSENNFSPIRDKIIENIKTYKEKTNLSKQSINVESINVDSLTIGDLKNYLNEVIYNDYIDQVSTFIRDFYISGYKDRSADKEYMDKIAKKINDLKNKKSFTIRDNGRYYAQTIYPYSFLASDLVVGMEITGYNINNGSGGTWSFPENTFTTNFEDDTSFIVPNIRIFCSGPRQGNINFYINTSYNRFSFLHETGHNTIMSNREGIIKILDKPYICNADENSFKKIEELIKDKIREEREEREEREAEFEILTRADLMNFEELVGHNSINSLAIYDILADMMATTVMVNELQYLNIKTGDIFKIMMSVYIHLSGDNLHFKTALRILLNIYISPQLSEYYNELIKTNGVTPYVDENYEKYKGIDMIAFNNTVNTIITLVEKISLEKFKEMTQTKYNIEFDAEKSKIDKSLSAKDKFLKTRDVQFNLNEKYLFKHTINEITNIDHVQDTVLQLIRDGKHSTIKTIQQALEFFSTNEVNDENYKLYYNFFSDLTNNEIGNLEKYTTIAPINGGGNYLDDSLYYQKYIKYKLKYINLKNSIMN